jgi:hypothetical protein
MQQKDDSTMLVALKEGSLEAYEYFFMKYYKPLCLKARMMLDSMDESEQVVRHLFVQVWEEKLYLDIEHSVGGYLYRMVHNSCVHYQQKGRSDGRLSKDPGFLLMQQVLLPLPGYMLQYRKQVALEGKGGISLSLLSDKRHNTDVFFILKRGMLTFKTKCSAIFRALILQIRP